MKIILRSHPTYYCKCRFGIDCCFTSQVSNQYAGRTASLALICSSLLTAVTKIHATPRLSSVFISENVHCILRSSQNQICLLLAYRQQLNVPKESTDIPHDSIRVLLFTAEVMSFDLQYDP